MLCGEQVSLDLVDVAVNRGRSVTLQSSPDWHSTHRVFRRVFVIVRLLGTPIVNEAEVGRSRYVVKVGVAVPRTPNFLGGMKLGCTE